MKIASPKSNAKKFIRFEPEKIDGPGASLQHACGAAVAIVQYYPDQDVR